jgi:Domain of unknown function (DUF4192)
MNITSPRQLIQALPNLTGAIDPDSLVLVELGDGEVCSHVTIANTSSNQDAFNLEESVRSLVIDDKNALVIVAISEDELHAATLLKRAQTLAEAQEIHVLDLLHVSSQKWRSILCTDDLCCPKSGNAIDDRETMNSVEYRQAHCDSDEVNTLRFRTLSEEELGLRALALASTKPWPSGSPSELFGLRDSTATSVLEILRNQVEDLWIAVAAVGNALLDIRTRDGVLRRVLDNEADRVVITHNLSEIFSVAPPECRPAIATVFAGAMWLEGDQAATRHALDIALEADSEYSLARLLDTALIHGVPHRVWVDSLAAVSYDKCLAGAA